MLAPPLAGHPGRLVAAFKRDGDINPFLADDCGLGKTVQALAAIYADYLEPKRASLRVPESQA